MTLKTRTDQIFKKQTHLLGALYEISIVHHKGEIADVLIKEAIHEIKRIEKLFSTSDENSQINQMNKMAGINPVNIDKEIYQLIERSIKISDLTQGAFDITGRSLDYKFGNSRRVLPLNQNTVKASSLKHNFRQVVLNQENHSIFLSRPGMHIGFDVIGKGYTIECVKRKLIDLGVQAGVVNVTGDLCTWGNTDQGGPWIMRIADPQNKLNMFSELDLSNKSIATSGDPTKFVLLNGRKNSHSINSSYTNPVNGISSVSIISGDAEISHTLTTPVMNLGIQKGLNMINQIKDIGCIIIDAQHSIYTSNNIRLK